MSSALLRTSYLALLAWQWVWHAIVPQPAGSRKIWLAALLTLPLLLTLRGVIRVETRSINWSSYLLLPYVLIGVMEAWSQADQRLVALVQTALVVVCGLSIGLINRQRSRARRSRPER